MSIDIQALPGGLVQNAGESTQTGQTQVNGGSGQAAAALQQQDSVSLTDSATRLRNLEQSLSHLPVVDGQRVEGVQRALATGSFTVNAVKSADGVLEMERGLASTVGNGNGQ